MHAEALRKARSTRFAFVILEKKEIGPAFRGGNGSLSWGEKMATAARISTEGGGKGFPRGTAPEKIELKLGNNIIANSTNSLTRFSWSVIELTTISCYKGSADHLSQL